MNARYSNIERTLATETVTNKPIINDGLLSVIITAGK
jgi:hypothetical protein